MLIALGALLLLANLGLLPRDVWRSAAHLWPVILVVLGAELLVARRISWAGVLLALIALVVLGAVAQGAGVLPAWEGTRGPGISVPSGSFFQQALEGAEVAEIELSHAAGRLDVTSGAGEGILAAVATDGEAVFARRYRVRNGVGSLDLSLERGFDLGSLLRGQGDAQRLHVRLSRDVTIRRLEVDAGAADMNLDLTDLRLQRLQVNAGASAIRVRLPARGDVLADLSTGASSLVVEVPAGSAARISIDGGLSSFTIDEQRFPRTSMEGIPGVAASAVYRSPDFDRAENRVDIRISAGASGVEVR